MRIVRPLLIGMMLGVWLFGGLVVLASIARTTVDAWGRAYVVDDPVKLPRVDTVLVLGTSPYGVRGQWQHTLSHRINTAAGLWHQGQADRFIVSGVRLDDGYDEAQIMRDELVARGIPANLIELDQKGNRTWDSIARARYVFGKRRLLIVSQRDHLARAIFLARHTGIEAWGVPARGITYGGWRASLVGDLASLIAFYDVIAPTPARSLRR